MCRSILLLVIIMISQPGWSTTFVVDDDYDGIAPTSACEQPVGAVYGTDPETIIEINAAADTSTPHTIRICPGTYNVNNVRFADIDLDDIIVEGTTGTAANIIISGTAGVDTFDVRRDNVTIQDMRVQDGRFLIETNANGTNLTLSNLELQNNSANDGIFIRSTDASISDISINNMARRGIGANAAGDDLILQNITIDDTVDDCIDIQGDNLTADNLNLSNCGDFGLIWRGTGANNVTQASLTDITITTTTDEAFRINNATAANLGDITLSNVNLTNSSDINLALNNVNRGELSDITITNSITHTDNIQLTNRSDNNTFDNLNTSGSTNRGLSLNNSRNNTFTNSTFSNNNIGINLTSNSRNNTFTDNIIQSNTLFGLRIQNNNRSNGNEIYNNCFSNTGTNIQDDETANNNPINAYDIGSTGNFYGSEPQGTGHSETCLDADDDKICDTTFTLPGTPARIDNFPRAYCGDANLSIVKTFVIQSDPINASNPKAISGAIGRYTITITNSETAFGRIARNANITDDLDNLITIDNKFIWQSNSMVITAPTINSGLAQSLSDAADADAGEFDNIAGNRQITVRCGRLLPTQVCTLTFDIEIQ